MTSLPKSIEHHSVRGLSQQDWDVIVIGAGPAGSVAAAYLAAEGHRTLLLDKEMFPRQKVCGDGLNHGAIRFLDRMGLVEAVRSAGYETQRACAFSTSGVRLVVPGPYISLQRRHLDALLADRAVQAGAVFCRGRVADISARNKDIRIVSFADSPRSLNASFVILATGANVRLARSLGLLPGQSGRTFPTAMAARCYVRSREKLDYFVGSYARPVLPGYGWIFPMGDDLYNMGVIAFHGRGRRTGATLRKRFAGFIDTFPLARRIIRSGTIISDLQAAPLRCGLPRSTLPGIGNLLATGETIGTTFNFTGEGIGKAMETGELAAKVIDGALKKGHRDPAGPYAQELDLRFRPKYTGYATAERWLVHPRLNDFMARRGVRSKYLQKAVMEVITRESDPRKAFSLQGIIRSFLV